MKLPKTFVRLGAEYYRNFSNDQSQEFYDWEDLRLRGTLFRVFTPKWFGSFSVSLERKNYQSRSVPAINIAERDDLLTLAASGIYQWLPHASLSLSVTYRHQDSNDPRLDFTDWIQQVGVTLNF